MDGLQKSIRDVISGGAPLVVGLRDTVLDVVGAMSDRHQAAALVATHDGLAGIFTERDYLVRVVAAGRAPETTQVGSVMTPDPDTLRLGDNVTFAINRMAVRGYRNVPIVDEVGHPVALIGVRDIVSHLAEIFSDDLLARSDEAFNDWLDIGGG
ncbi:MAG: CBS domain-containing protein [Myxococcota bacterium]|nr:CBS domain-containing protein [Myxococcota bacterium]